MHNRLALIARILDLIAQAASRLALEHARMRKKKPASRLLFEHALRFLGRDASPVDVVSDDLGCAESVSGILQKVIPFPTITGTWTLWDRFRNDPRFVELNAAASPGTIIISPTGTGNGQIRGHVGIFDGEGRIMSANSATGLWERNYTIAAWNARYVGVGGFPTYFFKLKGS